MRDNLKRAGSAARWYYPLLMKFEWPVLLKIMGKGKGEDRYLSVADVRTLFNERQFPARINQRLVSQPVLSACQRHGCAGRPRASQRPADRASVSSRSLRSPNSPTRSAPVLPQKESGAICCRRPCQTVPETTAAFWLEQNWSLKDRHWFHHASQGTATFPVPYELVHWRWSSRASICSRGPGMMKDSAYLERFGFIPSPQSIQTDVDDTAPLRLRQCL